MIVGVDKFRERFAGHEDNCAIIGVAARACSRSRWLSARKRGYSAGSLSPAIAETIATAESLLQSASPVSRATS